MSDEKIIVTTGEGRVINQSLFKREIYTDPKGREGDPLYKIEMAFDWDAPCVAELYDAVNEAAKREWGEGSTYVDEDGDEVLADDIRSPILDGDDLAAKREKKGKQGDAYAGLAVIRANTKYNKHGEDDAGGVYVAGPDGNELPFDQHGLVFNGSYGEVSIDVNTYDIDGKGVKFYLRGFRHTREGERLRSNDIASAFKPMKQAEAGTGRKARK